MAADETLRRALIAAEDALDAAVVDEVRREPWGTVHRTPSLPRAWQANWIGVEGAGLDLEEVAELAAALDVAGLERRTVAVYDEAEGARLAAAARAAEGWEVDAIRYMLLRGEEDGRRGSDSAGARELSQAEVEPLRRRLIAEEMPAGTEDAEAAVAELVELDRRIASDYGVRWFAAPAEGEPASACCLYDHGGGIGQVEDVGTLAAARGRGLARAVVEAALAAARERGDETIFLTADAEDWPQRFYQRLGFEPVGDLQQLRLR